MPQIHPEANSPETVMTLGVREKDAIATWRFEKLMRIELATQRTKKALAASTDRQQQLRFQADLLFYAQDRRDTLRSSVPAKRS